LDAEAEPWAPGAAHEFERAFEHAPTTAFELQRLLLRRLDEIDHGLVHDDFNQGRIFKLLPDETAVQNWIAHELRAVERTSYSVDREIHRVGEKKPDIVARAKASDANVAIEIKVVDGMSIRELEDALSSQLCDQYLRAKGGRHGILLLAYQHARAGGWRDQAKGPMVGFDAVVERLRAQAREIAGATTDAPQPVIAVLNASSLLSNVVPSPSGRTAKRHAVRRGKSAARARSTSASATKAASSDTSGPRKATSGCSSRSPICACRARFPSQGCAVLMFPPHAAVAPQPKLGKARRSFAPKLDSSGSKRGVRVFR
jgi:hypothetical protein